VAQTYESPHRAADDDRENRAEKHCILHQPIFAYFHGDATASAVEVATARRHWQMV
jgi:hypothetical protein